MKNCWQSPYWIPQVPAAIWQRVRGSGLFEDDKLTSAYFKTCCLNCIFLVTVIIYFALLFVDILLVLISRDVIKTSGDGVCGEQPPGSPKAGRKHGGEVPPVSVLKELFFLPPPPLLTLIAVQLKLPQFKYSWEYIELLGDAIGLHSAEVSRHKNPWSMSKIQL